MKNSDISFHELRDVLLELGFCETPEKTRRRFEHPCGSILLFKLYRGNQKVSLLDMHLVRGQLEDQGVIAAADFDRYFLQKTPA